MKERFTLPDVGPLATVRFPPISRDVLPNGVRLWSIERGGLPVITAGLVIRHGTAADPVPHPGLTSLVADLIDEGAGGRDGIELADAFARIGAHLDIEVSSDTTTVSITTLSRLFARALALLADIVIRPHLAEPDFRRVRELRQSRLQQLTQSASAAADRAFLGAVFGDHPYGHGQLGTIAALEGLDVEDARRHWAHVFTPAAATLIVVGDATERMAMEVATEAFASWTAAPTPLATDIAAPAIPGPPEVLIVPRPGASQSELRVGHLGPPRNAEQYHAIVVLNAILGGQFTSRINRNLRETRAITYGAATAFEMRRHGGSFSCSTGVQSNATCEAVSEILKECALIRGEAPATDEELARAKASLTRGYVRQFETTAQVGRAASVLATYDLPDDTFDQFVPRVEAVTAENLSSAAQLFVRPEEATVVVVGDAEACEADLRSLGRPIRRITPEF